MRQSIQRTLSNSPFAPWLTLPQSRLAIKESLMAALFAPVHIAALAYFRIAFGLVMLWEVWRYVDRGWISRYWIEPTFYFSFYGFSWVKPWAGDGMYFHFAFLGVLAICITLGIWYRFSTILFFLGFSYLFLIDQTHYLNHFYLICLLSFLMIFIPAERAPSLDSLTNPAIRSNYAPAWTLWLLRAQIGIVYFYGGIAKINPDWLQGEPMRKWLANRTDFPLIGSYFTEEWMVYLFSYGGLLLDLLIVPFLLWRRTRLLAFIAVAVFHITNSELFTIGIFPWFMIAATALFFRPDWPVRLFTWQTGEEGEGTKRRNSKESRSLAPSPPRPLAPSPAWQQTTVLLLGIYLAFQLLIPFRHHLYPSNVNWSEEGHRFSWRMKLRSKSSNAQFWATDPVNQVTWEIDVDDYLTERQETRMSSRPDMILQFAHHVADDLRQEGYEQIEIRAMVRASLNGRERQLLIDPEVDLAKEQRSLWSNSWILPLDNN